MRNLLLVLTSVACLALVSLLASSCSSPQEPSVSDYNVVWDSPSENAAGSMPIGNGEVGANFWVEPSGDMVFYISRTDAWSETGELYKLGRIRVSTQPAITSANDFCQTLDLENGRIDLRGAGMDLHFFIDSEANTLYLRGTSKVPVQASVKAEVWRDKEESTAEFVNYVQRSMDGCPDSTLLMIYPDHVMEEEKAIVVYHHNAVTSYDTVLDLQGLEPENRALLDPFLDRCFGYRVEGGGMQKSESLMLTTECPTSDIDIRISTFSEILPDSAAREDKIWELTRQNVSSQTAMQRTADFWNSFWDRSYIYVQTPDTITGKRVTTSYILQRWIQACGGRGHYPIKFNGSLFTVDPILVKEDTPFSPDFRMWGGDFWWQNTRLAYYPMLKGGDYDMMKPLFEHYFRNLPMMKAMAKAFAGVDGALSPETATPYGSYNYTDYIQLGNSGNKFPNNAYIRYHWDSSVEMISLMLDYYDYSCDKEFVNSRLVPYAREMLKFYDSFYGCDGEGKLLLTPTQVLETYWENVINDIPTVAGLHDVLPRLCSLPAELSSEEDKALWQRMTDKLPDIPMTQTADGKTKFAPAAAYEENRHNSENPELYPVFPFHLCNISTDNLQVGINSFMERINKSSGDWAQSGQQAARLGLTEEAAEDLLNHIACSHHAFRLPVFWGEPFDWTPDQCFGSNIMTMLQDMVLQTWDGRDYELPAFPKDWGVRYRLHSWGGKTVEGVYNWR